MFLNEETTRVKNKAYTKGELKRKGINVDVIQKNVDKYSSNPRLAMANYKRQLSKLEDNLNPKEKKILETLLEKHLKKINSLSESTMFLDEGVGDFFKRLYNYVLNSFKGIFNTLQELTFLDLSFTVVLTFIVAYINSFFMTIFIASTGSVTVGMLLGAVLIAPITEELAKALSAKYLENGGAKFGAVMGLLEMVQYVSQYFNMMGAAIILIRVPNVIYHYNSGKYYDEIKKYSNLDAKNIGKGIVLHAFKNSIGSVVGGVVYNSVGAIGLLVSQFLQLGIDMSVLEVDKSKLVA